MCSISTYINPEVMVMSFSLPVYIPPDFSSPAFSRAPIVTFKEVYSAGVAPEEYHATTIYPEYYQLSRGEWSVLKESRMDCVVVREKDKSLYVKTFRHLQPGDQVACGRRENGEDGIFVHTDAFQYTNHSHEKFRFRSRPTRESAFSIDYDELYGLLKYEREHGFTLWVLGPAVVFDRDARRAFVRLVKKGYVHALFAGNALATHDVEASLFGTALGQDLYTKQSARLGHYNHLDALNRVRAEGSVQNCVHKGLIENGVMKALLEEQIPVVLSGSIRDDGPMPEVMGNVYDAQDKMRSIARRATTVISMATQLHSIATGNMVPSFTCSAEGRIRPVYFYVVDMSEFAVSKLTNRGSLTARSIITNVQDFIVIVERGLS